MLTCGAVEGKEVTRFPYDVAQVVNWFTTMGIRYQPDGIEEDVDPNEPIPLERTQMMCFELWRCLFGNSLILQRLRVLDGDFCRSPGWGGIEIMLVDDEHPLWWIMVLFGDCIRVVDGVTYGVKGEVEIARFDYSDPGDPLRKFLVERVGLVLTDVDEIGDELPQGFTFLS